MENIFQFSPMQSFILLILNAWIFIIFPVLVIKKLNYLTALLKQQIYGEGQEE